MGHSFGRGAGVERDRAGQDDHVGMFQRSGRRARHQSEAAVGGDEVAGGCDRFDLEGSDDAASVADTNRVRRAQDLLETTNLSMEIVASNSGLGSGANLRHHFRQELRTTPTRYRNAFAATSR